MLEIIMLIYLTRNVGETVRRKNRRAGWYKFLTVVLWLGFEFLGGFVGGIFVALSGSSQAFIYLFALVGAALGAGIAFAVARLVPATNPMMTTPPPPPPLFGS